ncbi:MAG: FadR family transcriptional regulator [Hyphomicrobiales bacterium]|nr:FadR family transcriptional regulator [Hyphomicrobiales bacterium]
MVKPANQDELKGSGEHTSDAFSELVGASNVPQTVGDFAGGTLERPSIAERVTNRVIEMIKVGNLKRGDRLPTEHQMAVAFGISRPPLREALKALTIIGVLESRQGGRYTVTDLSPERLVAPFDVMLSIGDYDVEEQFEPRYVVDVELIRLCTERASQEERAHILKLAVDGRAFHDDPVAFRLLDLEFHTALYQGGRSRLLSAMAQMLYNVGLDIRRHASELPGVIEKSVAQHCEVAEAIVAGDADAAVAAYRQHLRHVRDTTIQSMAAKI